MVYFRCKLRRTEMQQGLLSHCHSSTSGLGGDVTPQSLGTGLLVACVGAGRYSLEECEKTPHYSMSLYHMETGETRANNNFCTDYSKVHFLSVNFPEKFIMSVKAADISSWYTANDGHTVTLSLCLPHFSFFPSIILPWPCTFHQKS